MLSILIPVYNYNAYPLASELHKQCLECEINFEILVFNDGGTQFENENLKIREFVYCTYIFSSKNIGRTQARNTLSNSAKFQSLLFLDADVIPSTSFFIKNYLHYITESN
ncbi:MAG: glycosyltransferase family A protein, partial [Ignavibacteria bacterium]|nr:glycosyltransferase family A protein [Ignavibacteria bacterium]